MFCFRFWRLVLGVVLVAAPCRSSNPDSLIGWGGDSFVHQDIFGKPSGGKRWVETLSWHPRAFLFHNFISEEEADQLVWEAAPRMKRSTVVGDHAGAVDDIRTSYGTFLKRLSSPTVELLEKRLANWTQLPIVHQEDVQVLRYDYMQKYGAHEDSLGRLCTVLVYLSTPDAGGETAFTKTTPGDWVDENQGAAQQEFSECAQGHVAAKPHKGDALLFYSLKPDGKTVDSSAMHTGCPLLSGVKWTATIWIHPTPFRPDDFRKVTHSDQKYSASSIKREDDPGVCMDTHEKCQEWSDAGECSRNPTYMTGAGSDAPGACRKSCKSCTVCQYGDVDCYHKNRAGAGYLRLAEEVKSLTGKDMITQF